MSNSSKLDDKDIFNAVFEGHGTKGDADSILTILRIPLYTITFLVHACGFFLLYTVKKSRQSRRTNRTLIDINDRLLMFLSFSELSGGFFGIITTVAGLTKQPYLVESIPLCLVWISQSMCLSTLYTITLHRLLSTLYPLQYRSKMTVRIFGVMFFITCVVVFASFGGGLALFWFGGTLRRQTIAAALVVTVISFYFIFSVFTYVRILANLLKSRRKSRCHPVLTANSFLWNRMKELGYITPLLITITYLVLVALPILTQITCLGLHGFDWESACFKMAMSVWFIGWNINNVSDAMIYIFVDKDIRRYLKQRISGFSEATQSLASSSRYSATKSSVLISVVRK